MGTGKTGSTVTREKWSGKLAVVMAAAGSAIGLGNIWMFPWRMGTYGGSAFLFIYVLIVALIGIVALMGELALGRRFGKGPLGALDEVLREKNSPLGKWIGLFPVVTTFAVTVFYMVVVGWIIHYFFASFRGFAGVDLSAYFNAFAGTSSAVVWHFMAVAVTGAITYLGVKKGLEPANKILLPILFFILAILMLRAVTLPGAMAGIRFMFMPNFAALTDPLTWFHALAQALFSLSLLGSTLVIYGSYLPKETDIPSAAAYTALFDTGAAILAALIVFPAAFAFGVNVNSGIPLLFITLPGLFAQMPAGMLLGALFFLLVVFAAITSAISLFESAIEPLMDALQWTRSKATLATSIAAFATGLPLALRMDYFSYWMRLTSAVLMPMGALIIMTMIFWVYGAAKMRSEVNQNARIPMGPWWEFLGKYVAVLVTLFILVAGTLRFTGLWK